MPSWEWFPAEHASMVVLLSAAPPWGTALTVRVLDACPDARDCRAQSNDRAATLVRACDCCAMRAAGTVAGYEALHA